MFIGACESGGIPLTDAESGVLRVVRVPVPSHDLTEEKKKNYRFDGPTESPASLSIGAATIVVVHLHDRRGLTESLLGWALKGWRIRNRSGAGVTLLCSQGSIRRD